MPVPEPVLDPEPVPEPDAEPEEPTDEDELPPPPPPQEVRIKKIPDESRESFTITEYVAEFDQSWNNVFFYGKEVNDFHTIDKSQIFALESYLLEKEIQRLGFIEDEDNSAKQNGAFKRKWLSEKRDAVTIGIKKNPSGRIENFLDVAESKSRFQMIDKASFSDVEFVPRARKDFSQIVISWSSILLISWYSPCSPSAFLTRLKACPPMENPCKLPLRISAATSRAFSISFRSLQTTNIPVSSTSDFHILPLEST